MPEQPAPKPHPHPHIPGQRAKPRHGDMAGQSAAPPWASADSPRAPAILTDLTHSARYAELQTTTNFTFLTGASHPEEYVERAAALDHCAASIADVNTLAGVVRAHVAAKQAGIPLAVGCTLRLQACQGRTPGQGSAQRRPGYSPRIITYPTDRAAYARLSTFLTLGKRRAPKGECHLDLEDPLQAHEGLLAVVIPPRTLNTAFAHLLHRLRHAFDDDRLSLGASLHHGPDDSHRFQQLRRLARDTHIPLAAVNDVHYHDDSRRALQDVLTCIRHTCTLEEAGLRLFPNAERRLKSPREMQMLFARHPKLLSRTCDVAARAARFSLDQLHYEYPREVCPPGTTPMQHLIALTRRGASARYPDGVPVKVQQQLQHEFALIDELAYAKYFLTVHDIVLFARSRGILCQGRGAAANSAVCYCLGVTAVDPGKSDLLFERFVSRERNEPPDIDIDFEHERREEVIQHIYSKFGRDRAALTAEVISYRGASAIRDVGKALGLSLDALDCLSKNLNWWDRGPLQMERLRELGFSDRDPTLRRFVTLTGQILGFPRHLSQHVGGFIITEQPLCELVPIENAAMEDRTVIEWDKDDIDAMGMLKIDVLGLGMLTCISKAFDYLDPSGEISLATVPPDDPRVYDMICKADTIGVFQIESRAQMSMLPRLRPRTFYDLVIEVAIVRPGPIQGKMVHPYLRRRNGEEPIEYPTPEVKKVLEKTLGVPLFQEQAMSLAMVAAGFSADEADQLRRAMAAWKRKGNAIDKFYERFVGGMLERGYTPEFAERCFEQLKGFSEYGFPESHAASFALLVYVSSWLKYHHPAIFAAALINSQPMGFYAPAQIVEDARRHGVDVRPVDVNFSGWECGVEEGTEGSRDQGTEGKKGFGALPLVPQSLSPSVPSCTPISPPAPALRLGFRLVSGLSEADGRAIEEARRRCGPFDSIAALWRAAGVRASALRKLAAADAFRSLGLDRRQALWEIRALRDEKLPIFEQAEAPVDAKEAKANLPPMSLPMHVMQDYRHVGLSLKAHPLTFIRERLRERGIIEARELQDDSRWRSGMEVAVAGIVLVRQRPSTALGIIFMTLEDETGIANLVLRPRIYDRFRQAARNATVMLARGRIEREGEVCHVQVHGVEDLSAELRELVTKSRDFH